MKTSLSQSFISKLRAAAAGEAGEILAVQLNSRGLPRISAVTCTGTISWNYFVLLLSLNTKWIFLLEYLLTQSGMMEAIKEIIFLSLLPTHPLTENNSMYSMVFSFIYCVSN